MKNYKLTLDLIPAKSWTQNVRGMISPANWELIRQKCFSRAGFHCEICGSINKLQLHEIFDYNVETSVQTLTAFITLCYDCHMVKHFGMSNVLGRSYLALKHLMIVNKIDTEEASQYIEDSFTLWHLRNLITWNVNLNYAKIFLEEIEEDLTYERYDK